VTSPLLVLVGAVFFVQIGMEVATRWAEWLDRRNPSKRARNNQVWALGLLVVVMVPVLVVTVALRAYAGR
jgi:hypothetical protein